MATRSSVHLPYIGDGQFVPSASVIVPKGGVNYEQQVVCIGDPNDPDSLLNIVGGKLDVRNLSGASDSVSVTNITGTPFYNSGTGGTTLVLTGGKRVLGIAAYANGGDGTITINGGNAITVRNGNTFSFEPFGNYINPTIVFSATLDWVVEGVT